MPSQKQIELIEQIGIYFEQSMQPATARILALLIVADRDAELQGEAPVRKTKVEHIIPGISRSPGNRGVIDDRRAQATPSVRRLEVERRAGGGGAGRRFVWAMGSDGFLRPSRR